MKELSMHSEMVSSIKMHIGTASLPNGDGGLPHLMNMQGGSKAMADSLTKGPIGDAATSELNSICFVRRQGTANYIPCQHRERPERLPADLPDPLS
jgi:hypothetical protein